MGTHEPNEARGYNAKVRWKRTALCARETRRGWEGRVVKLILSVSTSRNNLTQYDDTTDVELRKTQKLLSNTTRDALYLYLAVYSRMWKGFLYNTEDNVPEYNVFLMLRWIFTFNFTRVYAFRINHLGLAFDIWHRTLPAQSTIKAHYCPAEKLRRRSGVWSGVWSGVSQCVFRN